MFGIDELRRRIDQLEKDVDWQRTIGEQKLRVIRQLPHKHICPCQLGVKHPEGQMHYCCICYNNLTPKPSGWVENDLPSSKGKEVHK